MTEVMRTPVLVTGATGSLAYELIPLLAQRAQEYGISRIRCLSRGEHRQIDAKQVLKGPLDWFIGDIRDEARVRVASKDCKAIFHLAAFKSIDIAEYNPWEAVQTNIIGTQNVIRAAQENGVRKCMLTSTDKATQPFNLYGASKLVAEKLWIGGNVGSYESKFSAVRYGNQLASNGSVIAKWKAGNPIEVTNPKMTRFFITIKDAAKFILARYEEMTGGEVFIPDMGKASIRELVFAYKPKAKYTVTGDRPGEKLHEKLFSEDEWANVTKEEDHFILWPDHRLFPVNRRGKKLDGYRDGFSSEQACAFKPKALKEMIWG